MPNTAEDYYKNNEASEVAENAQLSPASFQVPQNGASDNYHSQADNYRNTPSVNHVDRLAQARKNDSEEHAASNGDNKVGRSVGIPNPKDASNTAKKMADVGTVKGAISLLKQINPMTDMPYVAAMGAAMLKDLVDLVAAETIILSVVFSMLCSIFIFMMLLLVGGNKKGKQINSLLKKFGVTVFGSIVDFIPGIDFLPIESLTVVILYFMELMERKDAQ